VLTLSSRIEEGFSFTEALKEFPQSFDNLYISLISAGEAAGDMSGILEKTASYLERRSKIQQDIIGALIYPLVLIILALVIVGLLLVFVVPNVVNQFDTLNQQLPLLTRVLISISDFLSGPAIWISLAILILLLGISRLIGRNKIRFLFEKHILKIPLINSFLINANLARFTSSLSILRNSNVPIIEALNISTSTISNSFLKGKMNEALSKVSEGDSLAKSLNKVQEIPLLVIQMIDSGERSGELDSMLTKAAEYLDQDFQQSTKIAMNLLEPMVVVLMGSIVASIVVAVLLPLIQMNNLTLIG
ncbi:MAG: type II secretion system F family protein, partial [SAR86 cluster bacterium]|nr:type II secretion system F family protein [SAR86 cluster bacterium]